MKMSYKEYDKLERTLYVFLRTIEKLEFDVDWNEGYYFLVFDYITEYGSLKEAYEL